MSRLSLFAVLLVAGVFGFAVVRSISHTEKQQSSYSSTIDYWVSHIRASGASAAYAEFVRETPDDTGAHIQAHAFGTALYRAVGISGIDTCTPRFGYGCFHGFIGDAITTKGLGVVADIDAACQHVTGPVGCQHGIGHGLVEHEGYTVQGVASALVTCTTLIDPPPFEGCYAGVFMEYATQIMLPGGPTPRAVAGDNYTSPCDVLDAQFQNACAYSQPHWWAYVLKLGPTAFNFNQLGELCRNLRLRDEARLDCFGGVGVRAGDDQDMYQDAASVPTLCDSAGTNDRERLVCRSMAAAYLYVTHGKVKAGAACGGLAGQALSYCQSYATGQTKFYRPQPLPRAFGGGFSR